MISELRSPSVGSRQRQKAATRRALLDAARAVVRQRGLDGVTTRAITDAAGVASGTFFVHFPSVTALVAELLDEHIAGALDEAYSTLPAAGLVERLVHVCTRLYDSYDVEPELSRAFVAASMFAPDRMGSLDVRLSLFRDWVGGELAAAVASGEVGAEDADVVFGAFFSLYFGLLVAGLQGVVGREGQVHVLRTALTRILPAPAPAPVPARRTKRATS